MMRRILRNPWLPHSPTPKQMAFLLLDDREALYGGAAGGGKSDAILDAAAMYVDIPGYNAIIFRRTLEDHKLAGGLVPRSIEWWGGKAKWNGADYRWTFPSGATISFGYMKNAEDHFRYQSSEYQYIGFDELTQFEEHQYRYMFSRLRRLEGVDIPLRMRAATNPGGVGHEWVRRRFIDPRTNKGRLFIPSRLSDNPHIDRTTYVENLKELDPTTREQLLNGDWDVRPPGSMFLTSKITLISQLPYEKPLRGVRYWDLAATDEAQGGEPAYTAGVLMLTSGDGLFYIRHVYRDRKRPDVVEANVASLAARDQEPIRQGKVRFVDTWMEQEPGSAGVNNIAHYTRVLQGRAFHGDKVTGSKADRARPFAAAVNNGNVFIVVGEGQSEGAWVEAYLDELAAFPEGKYKDQVDASSGAFNKLGDVARTPKVAY